MSVNASSWAWSQQTESSGQRLVLLALADAAGGDEDDPRMCWPSISRISKMTGIGSSTVKLHMERLAHMGLISKVVRRRRTDGTLGTWKITVNFLPVDKAVDEGRLGDGMIGTTADGSALVQSRPIGPHEPSFLEPSENTLGLQPNKVADKSAESVDFIAFYNAYPRKVKRPTALRAHQAAVKRFGPETVMVGTQRWIAYWKRNATATEFIPHPSTFLRADQFNDQPPFESPNGWFPMEPPTETAVTVRTRACIMCGQPADAPCAATAHGYEEADCPWR